MMYVANAVVDFSNGADWSPVARCPLCNSVDSSKICDGGDFHYGVKGAFPIFRCRGCGLQYLNPQPTPKFLASAYPSEYYSYGFSPYPTGWRLWLRRTKRALGYILFYRAHITRDPRFKAPGTMLDIGCGAGHFLAEMRAKGWKVHGVEISSAAAEAGRVQGGLDIVSGTLHDAKFPSAEFDYIRLNHSFEHVDNPREVLREIRRVIKPDGYLFIGVPNVESLPAKLFGRYWFNLGPPTHPYGYSPRSLKLFLEQEGFKVEKVGYNSTYAGVLGSIQILLNRRNGRSSHVGFVVNNPALKLVGQWVAQITDLFRMGDCIELIARPVSKSSPGA